MRKRWTAAGMLVAEQQFRRIIGYRDLAKLVIAIERHALTRRPDTTPTRQETASPLPSDHQPRGSPSKFHDDPDNLPRLTASSSAARPTPAIHQRPRADVRSDPPVPRLNELGRALAVHEVRIEGSRQQRRVNASDGMELDRPSDLVDQALQVESPRSPRSRQTGRRSLRTGRACRSAGRARQGNVVERTREARVGCLSRATDSLTRFSRHAARLCAHWQVTVTPSALSDHPNRLGA